MKNLFGPLTLSLLKFINGDIRKVWDCGKYLRKLVSIPTLVVIKRWRHILKNIDTHGCLGKHPGLSVFSAQGLLHKLACLDRELQSL